MLRFSILGCGRMGSWFAKSLKNRGADLLLYDIRLSRAEKIAESVGGRYISSLSKIPTDRPILLALPVKATGQVIGRLASETEAQLKIVEISAFKKPVHPYILRARRRGHIVASIHPLFGPGQKDDRGTLTLHVERRSIMEDRLVRLLLPNTRLKRLSVEEHDKKMLVALALTHFIGITASKLLSEIESTRILTKSLEALLSLVSISILESAEFYSDYPMTSREALRLFRKYNNTVDTMIRILQSGQAPKNIKSVAKSLGRRYDMPGIYERLYSFSK
ncbi:MAG: prephenate dehydrogenase/arogenate dehydrogenase family protein [Nitrososphaerota archaeon]